MEKIKAIKTEGKKMLTRKDLYNCGRVYRVGYCGAQNLLAYTDCEIGRNGGVCGWNWTAYKPAHDIVICTGYRNLTGIDANKITAKYDDAARAVRENYSLSWEDKIKALEKIRGAWIDALRAL